MKQSSGSTVKEKKETCACQKAGCTPLKIAENVTQIPNVSLEELL